MFWLEEAWIRSGGRALRGKVEIVVLLLALFVGVAAGNRSCQAGLKGRIRLPIQEVGGMTLVADVFPFDLLRARGRCYFADGRVFGEACLPLRRIAPRLVLEVQIDLGPSEG